jgi:hypothetical protein
MYINICIYIHVFIYIHIIVEDARESLLAEDAFGLRLRKYWEQVENDVNLLESPRYVSHPYYTLIIPLLKPYYIPLFHPYHTLTKSLLYPYLLKQMLKGRFSMVNSVKL